MKSSLYIVIVGCGRLGSLLANRLSRDGHAVVVIEERMHAACFFDAGCWMLDARF